MLLNTFALNTEHFKDTSNRVKLYFINKDENSLCQTRKFGDASAKMTYYVNP